MADIELTTTLPHDPSSAAEARRFLHGFLADSGESGLDEVAALLVSELVTNSVVHTRSAPEVTVRLDEGRLRVEVADESPTPPVRHRYSPRAATGRGMILVGELAAAWGSEPADTGKIVWFELDTGSPTARVEPGRRRLRKAQRGQPVTLWTRR
ncbi:MAG TPA: ATP-binding protein [Acidimicrobiales bacterium]|jgi:anti-sigma regulatory factor (Ser/Thr protein kinase)